MKKPKQSGVPKMEVKPPMPIRNDEDRLSFVCGKIVEGMSMTDIASELDLSVSTLSEWLHSNAERSARANEARRQSARTWDEKAEEVIKNAREWIDVHKARELAQHYRWRASKIAPREYGDKLSLEHSGELKIEKIQVEIVKPKE